MAKIINPKTLKGFIAIFSLVLLISLEATAQNEVAIGSATTKSNAILWLNGNKSQGLILPYVTSKSAVSGPDKGMIVYDESDNKVWYRNDNAWVEVGGSAGGGTQSLNLQLTGNQLQLRDGTTTLSSVNIAGGTQTNGGFMVFTGGSWQYAALSGDVTGTNGALLVEGIKGKTLPALPTTTQVLVYDGTAWKFQPLTGGTDSQDLSLNTTTNILSLTNDATPVDLSPYKQNLTLTGTTLGITGGNSVTLPVLGTGTVTSVTAGNGLAGGTITTAGTISIASGGVGATELADNAVVTNKIQDNAVTTSKITNSSVNETKLANDAVTTTKILDGTITGTDIANTTISADKLAASSATSGQVLKWNGTNWVPAADDAGSQPVLGANQLVSNDGTTNVAVSLTGDAFFSFPGVLNLRDGAVTTQKITDNVVTSAKITDGSITSVDIANTSITTDKLAQSSANTNEVLQWNGTNWVPAALVSVGTVTEILTGTGLSGGPITGTGTISIAAGGVGTTELANNAVDNTKLADNAVTNTKIASGANIDISKLNGGAANNNKVLKVIGGVVTYADDEIGVPATGDITDVIAGTGLTGGATTGAATLSLSNTAVTPASYGSATAIPQITIDAQGRITNATTVAPADNSATNELQNLSFTGTGSAATGESFPLNISSGTGVTIREGTNVQIDQAANVITINSVAGGSGTVTSVTGTAPINVATGTTTPVISIAQANTTTNGFLSSADWNTFNAKGTGTVTSVGLTMPAIFTVTNSPVTASGTLTTALVSQTAATVFAAPAGTAGVPVFRTLTGTDIPNLNAAKITAGILSIARGGTGLTAAPANGQLMIGNGAGYTLSTLTAGTGVNIANGAGSITISATGLANPMTAPGDIIFGGAAGAATRLATGSGFLKGGATPSYTAIDLATTDVTGVLPLTSGGTGSNTAAGARTSLGLGALATISEVSSAEITDGTITNIDILNVDAAKITTGTLPVARGGTNATATPTNGGVSYGTGTAYAFTPAGTSGQLLQSNGAAAPTWVNPFTNPMTTQGDIIVGGAAGAANRLPSPGASRAILGYNGTTPTWVTGTPNQLLGTDGAGDLNFINQSGFLNIASAAGGDVTGTFANLQLAPLAIVNADIATAAAIDGTKVNPVFGAQNISTTGTLTTGTAGQFVIDGTGNITKINNITTSFPLVQGVAGTVLTNDGAGVLSWAESVTKSKFLITDPASVDTALTAKTFSNQPHGFAISGIQKGTGDAAAFFLVDNIASSSPAVYGETRGSGGSAIMGNAFSASGNAAVFFNSVVTNTDPVVKIDGIGTGPSLVTARSVGIGTTVPLASLSVIGKTYVGGDGNTGYAGNIFPPTIDLTIDDSDTGLDVPADGELAVYANNQEQMRIVVGSVGIGTTTPTARLDIAGSIKITDGTQANGRVLTSDANGLASWQPAGAGSGWTLVGNGGTNAATNFIGTTDNIALNFRVNNQRAGVIQSDVSGQLANIGLGYLALAANTAGNNVAIGTKALQANSTAANNTAVGRSALFSSSTGFGSNTAIGSQALYENTTGYRNTAIGYLAGSTVGTDPVAGTGITTGNNNTFVGSQSGASVGSPAALTNATAIGANAKVTANNTMVFGNAVVGWGFGVQPGAAAIRVGTGATNGNGATLTLAGAWTNGSDSTKKYNVMPLNYGLSEVMQLKPVNYQWKNTQQKDFGFLAQDVKAVLPEIVHGEEGQMSVSYGQITSVLTKAIQEQQQEIEELKAQLKEKNNRVNTLESSVTSMKEELDDIKRTLGIQSNLKTNGKK